jgi:tetratricopeptide (TPR) repeat protein
MDLGARPAARAAFETARGLQRALANQAPAVPAHWQDLANTHNSLGVLLAQLGEQAAARAEHESARDLLLGLVDEFPDVPVYRQLLANTDNSLGAVLADRGERPAARAAYEAALRLQQGLADEFSDVLEYQVELGGSSCNIGNLLQNQGKSADSLVWYDEAVRILALVYAREPRAPITRQFLLNSHRGRAVAYDRLQRYAEAVRDWDRVVELSPPARRPGDRAYRATSRLRAGQVAEAVAEVAELTRSTNWTANQWYNFARVYAVAGVKVADKKQEYADRAMELLQKAVKAGYKDAAHMAKDPDLDPLRDRADFKQLLDSLAKAK